MRLRLIAQACAGLLLSESLSLSLALRGTAREAHSKQHSQRRTSAASRQRICTCDAAVISRASALQEPARYDSPTKPVSPGLRYASPSPAKGQMSRMGRNGSQASLFTPVPALCAGCPVLPCCLLRNTQLLDQRLRAQKLSAGVLSAALEECERKLQRNGPAVKEYRQMEAKAGANRDYAIAEMGENYVSVQPALRRWLTCVLQPSVQLSLGAATRTHI